MEMVCKMKSNLKPCPFCGAIPTLEYGNGINKWWISCINEKCRIQPTTDAHINKGVVVREWNKRVEPKCPEGCPGTLNKYEEAEFNMI